jgi:hypothetical protein
MAVLNPPATPSCPDPAMPVPGADPAIAPVANVAATTEALNRARVRVFISRDLSVLSEEFPFPFA